MADTEADLIAAYAKLDTATVSDALDRVGIAGQVEGVRPFFNEARICGRAHTLRYEPVDASGGTVGDFIDEVAPGNVLVLANQGRTDCTVWGDILTATASQRGVGGTVIDGICRDVAHSLRVGYPVFSRGAWMRTGKDRVRLAAERETITVSGVSVAQGDLVIGDADGAVVVPWADAARILDIASSIAEAEDRIRARVEAGSRLDEARAEAGYHSLQTRK